jgi:hypothetical protein
MLFYNDGKKKYINTIRLGIDRLTGVGNIFIKYDGKSYVNIGMLKESNTLQEIKIPISRCEKFSIKVVGYGTVTLTGIYKNIIWG